MPPGGVGESDAITTTPEYQDVADIVKAYPGRFVGVGSIDPSHRRKAIQQIDEALALGLKGITVTKTEEIEAWLVPVARTGLYLPYKILVPTAWGTGTVALKGISANVGAQRAGVP